MRPTRHLARAGVSALALAAALGLAACGDQTPDSVAAGGGDVAAAGSGDAAGQGSAEASSQGSGHGSGQGTGEPTDPAGAPEAIRLAAGDAKPRLVCPTGERSMMIADFAHGAEGAATPEGAVGTGLVRSGEHLVLSARGTTAWVLRPDGTARMEIGLLHDNGWLLHQRTSCG